MSELSSVQLAGVVQRAKLLHSEVEVEAAINQMAIEISGQLQDLNPVLLCVMNGGLITTGKLATKLNFPLQMDYIHASRYRNKTSGADLQWLKRPSLDLSNRVVLVIDDIFDEGATLEGIVNYCQQLGAAQVLTAVLTDKQHDRKLTSLQADFVGLKIADAYVYGYGLDYKGHLRNAAGIYAIDESDY